MDSTYLLTLAIPTYNRASMLDRALCIIQPQLEAAKDKIEFIVSDNCSTDNTKMIVEYYINRGMRIRYIRNKTNMGVSANVVQCYKKANGKYVWLIGDDDFLSDGTINYIINILNGDHDYGLLFHSTYDLGEGYNIFNNINEFVKNIDSVITWISGNILNKRYIDKFNFEKYKNKWMLSGLLSFYCAYNADCNIVIKKKLFSSHATSWSDNKGYNFFKVFTEEYFGMWKENESLIVNSKGLLKNKKKKIYKDLLFPNICSFLIHKEGSYDISDAWVYLFRYYWNSLYFYSSFVVYFMHKLVNKCKEHLKPFILPSIWLNEKFTIVHDPLAFEKFRWRYINPHNHTIRGNNFRQDIAFIGRKTIGVIIIIEDGKSNSKLRIGNNCIISPNVQFFLSGCDINNKMTGDIIIEDDVWIGWNVIICPGVTIGQGAIIQIGAVIRSDIPANATVIGNPSTIIGSNETYQK